MRQRPWRDVERETGFRAAFGGVSAVEVVRCPKGGGHVTRCEGVLEAGGPRVWAQSSSGAATSSPPAPRPGAATSPGSCPAWLLGREGSCLQLPFQTFHAVKLSQVLRSQGPGERELSKRGQGAIFASAIVEITWPNLGQLIAQALTPFLLLLLNSRHQCKPV